jgi:phage shock protein A
MAAAHKIISEKETEMEVISPQLKELERKHDDLQNTVFQLREIVAQMRGELDELRRTARDTTRQTIWQFVIFTVTMAVILIGGIKYMSDTLRNEMNIRFEAMERRIDQMEKNNNARSEQTEKNIIARFEDLKQEVRASRKQ